MNEFGFDGRLNSKKLTALQDAIVKKTGNDLRKRKKWGFEDVQYWKDVAMQRQEGDKKYKEQRRCEKKERIEKDEESFDDYRIRMSKAFRIHSGKVADADPNGVYQHQLKNALHAGSKDAIRHWVQKHYIGLPTGTLEDYINHALHAEKVTKEKKGAKLPAAAAFSMREEEEVFYYEQARNRGKGRGRGFSKGRGGFKGDRWRQQKGNECWTCGREGHRARDCPEKPPGGYSGTSNQA